VSHIAQNGAGQDLQSHVEVTARFTLHSDRGESLADAAAELIGRLQEMANLPRCAYELDVDVQWPDAPRALAPGGQGCPPGSQSDSR
jgi:hypothetical protein